MNRREFLSASGAVLAVAYCPIPSSIAAAEPVVEAARAVSYIRPWQRAIWRALMRGEKVMYATGTQQHASHVFNQFGRHKNLFCTAVNSAITGRGADYIIVDDFNDTIIPDWYDSCLRTRLMPGGKIDHIHT